MADNDPIKDYNEVSLKLDRLKEKMEMYVGYDDQVTDLHDCSNDLSDRGSRIEEYEHAKYAEKIRQRINGNTKAGFDIWNKVPQKKKSKNSSIVTFIVILIIYFVFTGIVEIIGEISSMFGTSYNNSYTDNYIEEEEKYVSQFESYAENITTTLLTTKENETYIKIYNDNAESYEDLKIETVFYNEYGEIIQKKSTYVNILLGKNFHYVKVLDAPVVYDKCEINVLDNYGKYTSKLKDDFIVEYKDNDILYDEETILLTNNCIEDINHLEVVVVYSNSVGEISLRSANFYDLAWGDVEEEKIYSYGVDDEEAEMIMITINDLY